MPARHLLRSLGRTVSPPTPAVIFTSAKCAGPCGPACFPTSRAPTICGQSRNTKGCSEPAARPALPWPQRPEPCSNTHFALEILAVPEVFRVAVDSLRGLGTCILVGSARAGTEVSFEVPWLQGGRTVRGVIQGDSRPREFIPRLVDLFMAGEMPLDRLITGYEFAEINRAAADATSGATIKPVLMLPQ